MWPLLNRAAISFRRPVNSNLITTGFSVWESAFRCGSRSVERHACRSTGAHATGSSSLAILQYLIYVIFYQRFIEDRLINFIDLCSVSNISVFILMEKQYGYYLHGRSPHGVADVNMKDMLMHFERESNAMIGNRGLQPNSTDQIFIVRVDRTFRSQYDALLKSYQVTLARAIDSTGRMTRSLSGRIESP